MVTTLSARSFSRTASAGLSLPLVERVERKVLLVVSGLILLQVSRFRRGERHVGSSVAGVVASLYLAVLFFAAVYYGFAHHAPGSVPGLRTRTDALYFSLTVTSTTGFGDIHAQSQAARAIASCSAWRSRRTWPTKTCGRSLSWPWTWD